MTRLVLKAEPPVRLAVDGLIPERLAQLSLAEIGRLPLALGNRRQCIGDWFRVAASDGAALEIEGDCRRLDKVGSGMGQGTLNIRGDVGAYLGIGLAGGTIAVTGNAGYGAATDMRGGMLCISRDAGDALGGALPGALGGMRGGTVLVAGRAGAEAGRRLRRGLIIVGGDAGTACGAEMVAGTIVAGGSAGALAGAAMRRGSIIALGGALRVGASFADAGVHDLIFLQLLARHLEALGLGGLAARLGPLRRWTGDAAVGGAGELLVPP
jgi:formylmethanofuran dehydrogenase subunit C